MSSIGDRIKEIRMQSGKSQYEVADAIGISRSRYAHYEQGRAEPDTETLTKIAHFFGMTLEYLVSGTESPKDEKKVLANSDVEPTRLIPVLGVIRGGEPIYAQEDILGYLHAPSSKIQNGYEYFYLRVIGDSMRGDGIFPGSYVLIRRQDYVEDGDIAVVFIYEFEEATVKRIRFIDRRVFLIPSNPEYHIQAYKPDEIKIIGKVIMVIHAPGTDNQRIDKPVDNDHEMLYNELISLFRRTQKLSDKDREQVRSLIRSVIDFVDNISNRLANEKEDEK